MKTHEITLSRLVLRGVARLAPLALAALPATTGPATASQEEPARAVPAEALEVFTDAKARRKAFKKLPSKTRKSVHAALDWLLGHQDDDGRFDGDGFRRHDGLTGPPPEDPGYPLVGLPQYDVGVTGLAVLALLGGGERPTDEERPYLDAASRGLEWLVSQVHEEIGVVGSPRRHDQAYCQAIATLALWEAVLLGLKVDGLRPAAERAAGRVLAARNPYEAWRYAVPPIGENDSSITVWMLTALLAAHQAGYEVPEAAYDGGLNWLMKITDPANGRTGYDHMGGPSARVHGKNSQFDPKNGEPLTAAAYFIRSVLEGEEYEDSALAQKQLDLVQLLPPVWAPESRSVDFYFWYYASLALFQKGSKTWRTWSRPLVDALLDGQRRKGYDAGSWDPVGPWGFSGGRVYSTAMGVLALTTSVRHHRVQ